VTIYSTSIGQYSLPLSSSDGPNTIELYSFHCSFPKMIRFRGIGLTSFKLWLQVAVYLLLSLVLYPSLVDSALGPTFSLESNIAFQTQKPCLQNCLSCAECGGNYRFNGGDLGQQIGCGNPPFLDSCICRADSPPLASSAIKHCVGNACSSNTVDIEFGYSLYNAYCRITASATPTIPVQTSRTVPSITTKIVTQTVSSSSSTRPLSSTVVTSESIMLWSTIIFTHVFVTICLSLY